MRYPSYDELKGSRLFTRYQKIIEYHKTPSWRRLERVNEYAVLQMKQGAIGSVDSRKTLSLMANVSSYNGKAHSKIHFSLGNFEPRIHRKLKQFRYITHSRFC